jgi:CheY-like chemotaxis protein
MPTPVFNILIVEDAAIIIKQLHILLSDKRHALTIQTANTAELGLQMIKKQMPDIIILDIKLPGISGIELFAQFKAQYPQARPLIIFLTNMPSPIYRQACLNNGADFFLDKSRDFLLLPEIIDQHIQQTPVQPTNHISPNSTTSVCNSLN